MNKEFGIHFTKARSLSPDTNDFLTFYTSIYLCLFINKCVIQVLHYIFR